MRSRRKSWWGAIGPPVLAIILVPAHSQDLRIGDMVPLSADEHAVVGVLEANPYLVLMLPTQLTLEYLEIIMK